MAGIQAQTVIATSTIHVGPSIDEVAERLVAALVKHKMLSPSPLTEFSEAEEEIARRAIESADAIVKANAAIVLGRPDEAREALEPASRITDEAFRYFTAMGDSFYFEGRFDEAVIWFERAFQMPGHDRDVMAMWNLALALQQSQLGNVSAAVLRAINL